MKLYKEPSSKDATMNTNHAFPLASKDMYRQAWPAVAVTPHAPDTNIATQVRVVSALPPLHKSHETSYICIVSGG
jgi:hypothetical protein